MRSPHSLRALLKGAKGVAAATAARGTAHDIQNLFTVVIASMQMLEDELTSQRSRSILRDATEAAHLGERLANRLRDPAYRRTRRGTRVDLGPLITETLGLLRRTLNPGVTIDVEVAHDSAPVLADAVALQSALLNLVLNASEALPEGGSIGIEVRPAEILVGSGAPRVIEMLIGISDTGCGMSPEIKRLALEPDFTTKRARGGSGLGLAQAELFARQNGGRIEIESELGRGTTVRLYLPVLRPSRLGTKSHQK